MSEFKIGDRIRVTFEAPYSEVTASWVAGSGYAVHKAGVENLTVEKIEPPVEVFKPGDVLRQKDYGTHFKVILTKDGYTSVDTKTGYARHTKYDSVVGPDHFTSKSYVRTTIA